MNTPAVPPNLQPKPATWSDAFVDVVIIGVLCGLHKFYPTELPMNALVTALVALAGVRFGASQARKILYALAPQLVEAIVARLTGVQLPPGLLSSSSSGTSSPPPPTDPPTPQNPPPAAPPSPPPPPPPPPDIATRVAGAIDRSGSGAVLLLVAFGAILHSAGAHFVAFIVRAVAHKHGGSIA